MTAQSCPNLTAWAAGAAGREKKIGESLPLTGALPCYNLYKTAEGDVLALAALEPHFWRRFCAAAGQIVAGTACAAQHHQMVKTVLALLYVQFHQAKVHVIAIDP